VILSVLMRASRRSFSLLDSRKLRSPGVSFFGAADRASRTRPIR